MKFSIFLCFLLAVSVASAEDVPLTSSESIYNLKSSWKTQDQNDVSLASFRGKLVILAMIYTSCNGACPMLIVDIQSIERALPKDKVSRISFLLVSFDPENDSPKKLREYAKAHGLDLSRWTLLQGSQKETRELAAALDVRFKKTGRGEFDHSSVITLLDTGGNIKFRQVGLKNDPKEMLLAIQNL